MKNDYPELNFDMEHLLQTKKYEELTPEELNEISDFISSKEDYVLMQNTFLSVKTSFGAEEEILPAENTKSKLMQAFESKHGGKVVSINKPRPFYLNPLFQVGVAAVFIIGIIFFYPAGKNENNMTAMNHEDENKSENVAPEEESTDLKDAEEVTDESPVTEITEKETDLESESEKSGDALKADVDYKAINVTPKGSADKLMEAEDVVTSGYSTATVTTKNSPGKDLNVVMNRNELAKGEKSDDNLSDDRSKEASAGVTFNSTSPAYVSDESVAATSVSESKKSSKKDKAEEKAKEKKEADVRNNSIGGRYYQPATAMDVKVGVSLKDQPDLTTFLFTAL